MKLGQHQLEKQIQQGLSAVYCISGDEPLLLQEACDLVRSKAHEAGYHERIVMHAESGFDWNTLRQEACDLSLFSRQRLLELRLPSGKPGDAGSKVLQEYAVNPDADNILLVICKKLDAASQKTRWFKALDNAGVIVQIWPMAVHQLPGWIAQRMRKAGMQPTPEALVVLADRVEGNMLAAAQEIEKLHMLYGSVPIDVDDVMKAVVDSARYDIFNLVDSALSGDVGRMVKMLDGLRAEGVEATLILWSMTREIRQLIQMSGDLQQGMSIGQVLSRYRVWDKRKPFFNQALQRSNHNDWLAMLQHAARVDLCIKGLEAGNFWDELLQLALRIAGQQVPKVA